MMCSVLCYGRVKGGKYSKMKGIFLLRPEGVPKSGGVKPLVLVGKGPGIPWW